MVPGSPIRILSYPLHGSAFRYHKDQRESKLSATVKVPTAALFGRELLQKKNESPARSLAGGSSCGEGERSLTTPPLPPALKHNPTTTGSRK
ncbi:hypothetical protein TELCIR_15921, partial [Teladorsagia circumcincta]